MNIPDELIQALQQTARVTVMTGAGISQESGIPTFRDAMEGLWAKYDPAELATPEAFERDPERVTRWYDERRMKCLSARPNAGHHALARMESAFQDRGDYFVLITQNIDGLHRSAGSRDVIELHGSIRRWRCVACNRARDEDGGLFETYPPRCECGGMRRPDVVWFGEFLPEAAVRRATAASLSCNLFLSVGTSGVVYPAADLLNTAKVAGAKIVEVNPEPTPASAFADWMLPGRAGDVLPKLAEITERKRM